MYQVSIYDLRSEKWLSAMRFTYKDDAEMVADQFDILTDYKVEVTYVEFDTEKGEYVAV